MADEEQLELLKNDVIDWNEWRTENPSALINLSEADLSKAYLRGANLTRADLFKANLRGTNLRGANLSRAVLDSTDLSEANLRGADLKNAKLGGANLFRAQLMEASIFNADLSWANLSEAGFWNANLFESQLGGADLSGANLNSTDLSEAIFSGANLSEAKLGGADLRNAKLFDANLRGASLVDANLKGANLTGADLSEANLRGANLRDANLNKVNFLKALFGYSDFGNTDLSSCKNLETTIHRAPSTIGTNTLQKSKGQIPIEFLRGCGLSDWEIKAAELYNPNLKNQEINDLYYEIYDLRAQKPFQISPLFISYSHKDSHFVETIEENLTELGIRFWRDVHHATAGRLEKVVDQAIRHNPTVLIIFSKNSIKSDWVQHEVESARELEKDFGRDVLCPIALDDSWEKTKWPKRLMRQVKEYNILDFSKWEDNTSFKKNFKKLIDGLELFYSG